MYQLSDSEKIGQGNFQDYNANNERQGSHLIDDNEALDTKQSLAHSVEEAPSCFHVQSERDEREDDASISQQFGISQCCIALKVYTGQSPRQHSSMKFLGLR